MTCLSFCDVKNFVVSGGDVILLALFLDFFLAEGIPTDVNATPLFHNVIVITRIQVESLKSKPSKPRLDWLKDMEILLVENLSLKEQTVNTYLYVL